MKRITEVHNIGAQELIECFNTINEKLERLQEQVAGNPETKILTRKEVAQMFGITLPTLHSWCKNGVLPYHKIGNQVRFKQSEVLRAMESGVCKKR